MASLIEIGAVGFPRYSMSLFLAAVVLSLLLFFLVVGTDYIDGWSKRKSLGEIPVIDDGSCLSPRLRWTRSNWNMAEVYEKAYQSVRLPQSHSLPLKAMLNTPFNCSIQNGPNLGRSDYHTTDTV